MRQFTCPKAVTHPSTNRARCRATALIETNALPLHQTANRTIATSVMSCITCRMDWQSGTGLPKLSWSTDSY